MWCLVPSHNQIGELTKNSQAPGMTEVRLGYQDLTSPQHFQQLLSYRFLPPIFRHPLPVIAGEVKSDVCAILLFGTELRENSMACRWVATSTITRQGRSVVVEEHNLKETRATPLVS
jgi:hypothetical protein